MTKKNDAGESASDAESAGLPGAPPEPSTLLVPAEREAAIQTLSAAFAADYITAEEFERRATKVYEAATLGALAEVTADLPNPTDSRLKSPAEAMSGRISTFLSSVERGGSLAVPSELMLRSVLGNIELDLRDARFVEGITEIRVRCILGNVEVILPEDVEVECRVRAFLGNFGHRTSRRQPGSRPAPSRFVRITGRAILSNVEVADAPRTGAVAAPRDSRSLPPESSAE